MLTYTSFRLVDDLFHLIFRPKQRASSQEQRKAIGLQTLTKTSSVQSLSFSLMSSSKPVSSKRGAGFRDAIVPI